MPNEIAWRHRIRDERIMWYQALQPYFAIALLIVAFCLKVWWWRRRYVNR